MQSYVTNGTLAYVKGETTGHVITQSIEHAKILCTFVLMSKIKLAYWHKVSALTYNRVLEPRLHSL